jgi:hypothetical protein
MTRKRDYRLVAEDGVAPASELGALYEAAALARRRKESGACKSTLDALLIELRSYGLAALAGPNCRRRLSEVSTAQLRGLVAALIRSRPKYPAITDDLLLKAWGPVT